MHGRAVSIRFGGGFRLSPLLWSPSSDPTEWEDAKFDWSRKGTHCTRTVVVNMWLENEENFKDEH